MRIRQLLRLRQIVVVLMFAFFCHLEASQHYVSLDLSFSADSATVPSRALLADMRIGIYQQRYGLMLDFNATRIEIDQCLRTNSRTFNVAGQPTDLVPFEEAEFMDTELRDYFRMPVDEHCGVAHSMPEHFYGNCLSERCNGIIGLAPLSSVWEIWTAFTLSLESLHLGRSNPFFHSPPSSRSESAFEDDDNDDIDAHVVVDCRRDARSGLCEFAATIGGIPVTVDFHVDDSYIYVPHHIYSLYMSSVSLSSVHGSKRLDINKKSRRIWSNSSGLERRQMKRDSLFVTPPDDQKSQFHDKLAEARDAIAGRSTYYRNSLHRFTMTQWLPLVVELDGGALVLDSDLLVHSPSYANSYAGAERSASEHFFGESSSLQQTVLLKPHPTDPTSNHVSIGNGILRRYTLHVDKLSSRMLIEERVIVEHLTTLEVIAATLLFTFFLRSVCYSLELLAPLSLCVEKRCPGCALLEDVDKKHRRVTSHSIRESLFFALILIVPPIALARLPVFVPYGMRFATFYLWAWTTLAVNGVCLLANLYYSAMVARGNRPPSGSYCWRSFRIVLSRAACSEQLALLGLFCLTVILRREELATPVSAVVASLAIANAVRHIYQVIRFKLSVSAALREQPPVERPDFPRRSFDTAWGAFFVFVLIALNALASAVLFSVRVFWPVTTFSSASAAVIVALSVSAGIWLVNQYADAEMKKD
jgi:hypothetical protein